MPSNKLISTVPCSKSHKTCSRMGLNTRIIPQDTRMCLLLKSTLNWIVNWSNLIMRPWHIEMRRMDTQSYGKPSRQTRIPQRRKSLFKALQESTLTLKQEPSRPSGLLTKRLMPKHKLISMLQHRLRNSSLLQKLSMIGPAISTLQLTDASEGLARETIFCKSQTANKKWFQTKNWTFWTSKPIKESTGPKEPQDIITNFKQKKAWPWETCKETSLELSTLETCKSIDILTSKTG